MVKDMVERSNREIAEKAFRDGHDGTGSITDLLSEDLRWTIVGRSQVSKIFDSKEQFIGEVLGPFGARFSQLFRPVAVRGIYADGDTVVVVWDGEGTRRDGKPYKNTYAWFMRFHEGLVVEATAFFDSIAFNELRSEVTPPNWPDGPTKRWPPPLPPVSAATRRMSVRWPYFCGFLCKVKLLCPVH